MNQLGGFYIKRGDFYLQHFSLAEDSSDPYYCMTSTYAYRYTTDDLDTIIELNDTIEGIIYASHGCDICV